MLTRHDGTAGSHVLLLLRSKLRHILKIPKRGIFAPSSVIMAKFLNLAFRCPLPPLSEELNLGSVPHSFERRRLHLICEKIQPLRNGPSRILARLLQSLFGLFIELFGDVAVRENAEDCDGRSAQQIKSTKIRMATLLRRNVVSNFMVHSPG